MAQIAIIISHATGRTDFLLESHPTENNTMATMPMTMATMLIHLAVEADMAKGSPDV